MIDQRIGAEETHRMGPRTWAAIGNILRISAVFGYLSGAVLGYRAIELNQRVATANLVPLYAGGAFVAFFVAVLLWNLKGPLIRGNLIARVLVGAYMLLWIISTLGFALIFIGIVYLFTGEPDNGYFFTTEKQSKPRNKAPHDWQPTGRVGPSGAMIYSTSNRASSIGILESSIPVQVMDKRNGLAQVVAASGEGGWIDVRTLMEGA